jgi:hypothetical protein
MVKKTSHALKGSQVFGAVPFCILDEPFRAQVQKEAQPVRSIKKVAQAGKAFRTDDFNEREKQLYQR